MILVGYTEKRGTAWHYRAELQEDESNHYPGAIPVDDVIRRLFNFSVMEAPQCYVVPGVVENAITSFLNDQNERMSVVSSSAGRKGMLTDDSYDDLGSFKDGYQGHGYQEWLLENVATILGSNGSELGIGSAGLLRNRAQAFVSVEMPDTLETKEGIAFRPHLLACTSYDGSIATTYKPVVTVTVCDNTLQIARSEDGNAYKLKHTRYSTVKINDAREALGLVFKMADDFKAEVAKLCSQKVSKAKYENLLDALIPVPEDEGRGKTVAENKRAEITALYFADDRAAPWNGTAYGVLAAFNTWNTHNASVRKGVSRFMRNTENVLTGKMEKADNLVLSTLASL